MHTLRLSTVALLTFISVPVAWAANPPIEILKTSADRSVTSRSAGPSLDRDSQDEQAASFQPKLFDPSQTKSVLDKKSGFWKVVADGQTYYYSKNSRNNGQPITLADGYTLDVYAFQWYNLDFGDEYFVDTSFVFEIKKKDGTRHALYTHVLHTWSVSPDGKTLSFQNYVKKGREWLFQHRLIDVGTKKAVNLPITGCSQDSAGEWYGSLLLTLGDDELCLWTATGSQVTRLRLLGGLNTSALVGNDAALVLVPGLTDSQTCNVAYVTMDGKTKLRKAAKELCEIYASIEWDDSMFTLKNPTLKYRTSPLLEDANGMHTGYGPFGPWRTLGN